MKAKTSKFKDQSRWNEKGARTLKQLLQKQNTHIINQSPFSHLQANEEILATLSPFEDREILELGCGAGRFSVFLAKLGAQVTAIDLGHDLITAASKLAELNNVSCEFRQANAIALPFEASQFDVVFGNAILHHLSGNYVPVALAEAARVLKPGGLAIFREPVSNSRIFSLFQKIIPAGTARGTGRYRPSILNYRAWNNFIAERDDRQMSNKELIKAGEQIFREIRISNYGLFVRFHRLIGNKYRKRFDSIDRYFLRHFPPLKQFSRVAVAIYQK
jgi:2-polyprenyl-3-methyl-5-hydroxy-6-metoxy-1,4-benzoquinol methylase